jgi:hypothetical protein
VDFPIDTAFSALAGGGIAGIFAQALIAKSLRDLEKVAEKVAAIDMQLSAINVKLGFAEKQQETLRMLEQKVAVLETRHVRP